MSDLPDRFFGAITAGDLETIDKLYSPEVRVWHNYDDAEQDKAASLKLLSYLHRKVGPLVYHEVRRITLPDGFIQQHVVECTGMPEPLRMPVMARIYHDQEHVTRIEEYVDPSELNAHLARKA